MLFSKNQKFPLLSSAITLFGLFFSTQPAVFALENDFNNAEKYIGFKSSGDITRFEGETLFYDISFLWFENAASAKVRFFKEREKYYSTLEASTKGFIGFFTSYRKHFYKTEFEIIDDRKSLRPKTFSRQVTIGNRSETARHNFNYSTRKYSWSKFVNDKKIESGERDIPAAHSFHDILTAFYNVRNSSYGPLTKGQGQSIQNQNHSGKRA